jgi:hypothetical protein
MKADVLANQGSISTSEIICSLKVNILQLENVKLAQELNKRKN